MNETALAKEVEQLTNELAEAELELVRLQARVFGLRAQRDALAEALTESARSNEPLDLAKISKRTDAVAAILEHERGNPLSIGEVEARLGSWGWLGKAKYRDVAATLSALESDKRITKVARGSYMAT